MSWQKMKSWQHTLAGLAVVTVVGQPQMLLAVELAPPNIGQRMEVPRDIMLAEGGLLVGQLVNEQGAAIPMAAVSLNSAGKDVARVNTDKTGNFRVKSLHGGVYSVEAKGHHGIYRLWSPQTAPPAAQQKLTMVSHNEVVRGQFAPPSNNPLKQLGQFVAEHPIITAGAVVAAIAIPIALDDDDDPVPATP